MCDECPNTLKPRFKGVENFLRRIAFNLGNSPSQTDVKIISCIPIDVTDLQQKICDLERVVTRLHKPPAIVHTALCEPAPCESQPSGLQESPTEEISKDSKRAEEQQNITVTVSKPRVHEQPVKQLNKKPGKHFDNRSHSSSFLNYFNGNWEKSKKTFLKKARKKAEKKWYTKPKSHLVYYAQTDTSPFKTRYQNKKSAKVVNKKLEKTNIKKETKTKNDMIKNPKVSSSLAAVVCKQYGPFTYKSNQLSGESEFSSPICRDIEYSSSAPNTRSDICSCCHMDFLNIDKEGVDYIFTPTFQDQIKSQNMYYDSSLYDLVPVKEAPVNVKKNLEQTKIKKHYRTEFDYFDYFDYRADRPYDREMFVNYHTLAPPPRVVPHSIPRRKPSRTPCKERPINRRKNYYNKPIGQIQDNTSNSCNVEYGDVYQKVNNKKHEPLKKVEVVKNTVTYNDAETITINNSECQTVTITQNAETELSPSDGKTEETLNQIKSILQSVLTEVKTNSKLKPHPEEKTKKDAVVQKGASFGNIPGSSRLLHSFSYGAYNSGPYMASCSHQMNPGQHWPRMPYSPKCVHNYPVFIQTPGRIPYAACYRNNSHVSKPSAPRPQRCVNPPRFANSPRKANSASTNTDEHDKSHETETLIKEIYKSIALNIQPPKKDISTSNCSSIWKRSSRVSAKSSNRTDNKSLNARQVYTLPKPAYERRVNDAATLSQFSSSILRRDSQSVQRRDVINSVPLTPFSSNTFSNKMTSNTLSVQSRAIRSTDTERRSRNTYNRHYLDTTMETPSEEEDTTQAVQTQAERKTATATTAAMPLSSSSSEESEESDLRVRRTIGQSQGQPDIKTEIQKKQRSNLFSKMIKSVKLFKNKKKKSQISKVDSEEEESDSDDYQTIYSQQVKPPRKLPLKIHIPARKIPHSKVSYSRQMRGRNQEKQMRRTPLEQEYRRQWNEELTFQPRPRHSTDQSMRSYKSGPQRSRRKQYMQPQMQQYMQMYMQPHKQQYQPVVKQLMVKQPIVKPPPMVKPPVVKLQARQQKQFYSRKPVMVEQSVPVQNTMFQDILTAMPKQKARPATQRVNGPPMGLSWFQKRIHCGQNIVKSLIEEN